MMMPSSRICSRIEILRATGMSFGWKYQPDRVLLLGDSLDSFKGKELLNQHFKSSGFEARGV